MRAMLIAMVCGATLATAASAQKWQMELGEFQSNGLPVQLRGASSATLEVTTAGDSVIGTWRTGTAADTVRGAWHGDTLRLVIERTGRLHMHGDASGGQSTGLTIRIAIVPKAETVDGTCTIELPFGAGTATAPVKGKRTT